MRPPGEKRSPMSSSSGVRLSSGTIRKSRSSAARSAAAVSRKASRSQASIRRWNDGFQSAPAGQSGLLQSCFSRRSSSEPGSFSSASKLGWALRVSGSRERVRAIRHCRRQIRKLSCSNAGSSSGASRQSPVLLRASAAAGRSSRRRGSASRVRSAGTASGLPMSPRAKTAA